MFYKFPKIHMKTTVLKFLFEMKLQRYSLQFCSIRDWGIDVFLWIVLNFWEQYKYKYKQFHVNDECVRWKIGQVS